MEWDGGVLDRWDGEVVDRWDGMERWWIDGIRWRCDVVRERSRMDGWVGKKGKNVGRIEVGWVD